MTSISKLLLAAVMLGAVVGSAQAQNGATSQRDPSSAAAPAKKATLSKPAAVKEDVPAYHASAPTESLPDTLTPEQFPDAQTQNIYALAAKEKSALYQQPCYCRCDKEVGHKSLLDCYVDTHAAHCVLCKKEAIFTYTEIQAGKTAAQIRKEIMDGKWKDVDLSKYDALPPAQ